MTNRVNVLRRKPYEKTVGHFIGSIVAVLFHFLQTYTQISGSKPTVEKGSLSKNGEILANDELFEALSLINNYLETNLDKFDTYKVIAGPFLNIRYRNKLD